MSKYYKNSEELVQSFKGGVIMDVTNVQQAEIAVLMSERGV